MLIFQVSLNVYKMEKSESILALDRLTMKLPWQKESAKIYALAPGETLKDITQMLMEHPNTSDQVKHAITQKHHRYYVFSYPSDGLSIKGYVSLPENTLSPLPLIIVLRGGQRFTGLPFPRELTTQDGYAVVCTTNRGAVSEGEDEYGGNDVNDVKNLIDFLPTLEDKLHIQFHPTDKYMIGLSRGGMQMFLALERYPELQQKIKKIVSLSGLLNIAKALQARPNFKEMLVKEFGLPEDEGAQEWILNRQPMHSVSKLSKHLSIMIAQGTQDDRVCLIEGYDMLQALHDAGHEVTYVEIEGGDHLLANTPDFTPMLMDWLSK